VIEEIDEGVGRILATLRRHGVDRNTIVVFTSDNGPMDMFRERGGSAGPLRGGKGSTWEGGMRVPGIFWAPGRIRPGTVRDPGSQLDLLPTLADIAGQRLPDDRSFDGVSLRATLQTLAPSPRRRIAYYRQGELYAIREGRLKAHFVTEDGFGVDTQRSVHNPALVFDLGQDPAERYPLDKPSPEVLASFSESKKAFERDVIFAPSELVKGVPSRRAEDNETR
jgi:arylsulfatase A-like enzyme